MNLDKFHVACIHASLYKNKNKEHCHLAGNIIFSTKCQRPRLKFETRLIANTCPSS